MNKKVTVVTATTGNEILKRCLQSVYDQNHTNVQHLLIVDGPEHFDKVDCIVSSFLKTNTQKSGHVLDIIRLPYSTGKDRWICHRIYGASSFFVDGVYMMYLDDDNTIDSNHISSCINTINVGNEWCFSLRKLVSSKGDFLGLDNCESLGMWPSVIDTRDYMIDTNCYFLPTELAVMVSSGWYRKFREPGQVEADRNVCQILRSISTQYNIKFDCTYTYSVNYTVSNTALSVTPEFFERGNKEMLRRFNGNLPWVKN